MYICMDVYTHKHLYIKITITVKYLFEHFFVFPFGALSVLNYIYKSVTIYTYVTIYMVTLVISRLPKGDHDFW